jgi:polyisoprenoid-binding protein YceI
MLGLLIVVVALAGGIFAYRVFNTAPTPVAVTETSGVAQFNFRVTGIPVPGVVPGLQATVQLNPNTLAATTGIVRADLTKLNTGLALRDEHAKDYLGVAAHSTATFAIEKLEGLTTIAPGERKSGSVHGKLSLNGTQKQIKAPIDLDYTKKEGIAVSAHFNVAFKDYAISIPGADENTDITATFLLPTKP